MSPRIPLPLRTPNSSPLRRILHTPTQKRRRKICLVTGASRGIGLAIASRLAALPQVGRCVLVGRDGSSLERARDGVLHYTREKHAGEEEVDVGVRIGDVAERAFWEGVSVEEKDIDILINAAGLTHASLLLTTSPALVEQVVHTNLTGTIWACQLVGKNMLRRRHGVIVNVSSLLGVKGGMGSSAYAASKAGVLGLTRSLAAELGPSGIRVNALVPGYVDTKMTADMSPPARTQALDAIPMRRFGTPEEMADAAVFLATNAYANNCLLNLDGGLSAV